MLQCFGNYLKIYWEQTKLFSRTLLHFKNTSIQRKHPATCSCSMIKWLINSIIYLYNHA